MRALTPPPDAVIDPVTRAPRTGSYRGPLPAVDLGPLRKGKLFRITHHKRWMYVAIASEELFLGVAIAHIGYLANSFAFAYSKAERRMLVDRSALGPPFAGAVSGAAGGGFSASFRLGGASSRIERSPGAAHYAVDVQMKGLRVHARLDAAAAPPPIGVIAPVPGGVLNTTEKRALLAASGEVVADGKSYSLDGGLGGYDYTNGYLARHTTWRWAFALGRARTGERVGLNLVEGFVGEPECALWIDGELHPLAEGRFTFDRRQPLGPWRVATADGAVDLAFAPGGLHHEHKDYGILRSLFIQPVGTYSGTIEAAGKRLELDGVLGVAEDQDMLW